MKKIRNGFVLVFSLLLSIALPLTALAEAEAIDTQLEGLVTEIIDGGFLMEDIELGQVLVNVSDATIREGLLSEEDIAVGQYVFVTYSGRLTRSLPPQAHADRVAAYVLSGTVGELMENGSFLLVGDEQAGDVIVHLGNTFPPVVSGVPVTVYFNGIMALSLPGQVNASHVIVPQLDGVVSEKDDEGFTLTDTDGVHYRVLYTADTVVALMPAPEAEAAEEGKAAEETENEETDMAEQPEAAADEAQATDEAEPTDETEENVEIEAVKETEGGEEAKQLAATEEPVVEWGDGDIVTVLYNGITTRSIPAQLTALEILLH